MLNGWSPRVSGQGLAQTQEAWRGHCCQLRPGGGGAPATGRWGRRFRLTSACMSYMVLRWSQMTLDGTCRPMFWLNLSLIQIMWKCRFTPAGEGVSLWRDSRSGRGGRGKEGSVRYKRG